MALFTLRFIEVNKTFDYIGKLRTTWIGIGTNVAVMLLGELSDIEDNGPRGHNEIIDGVTLYFAMIAGHCIAHAANPTDPTEIIVSSIFPMHDFATGRDEAWRLLNTVVAPVP
jgi:hypothetical protein